MTTVAALPAFPPAASSLEQAGFVWAVILAAVDVGDPTDPVEHPALVEAEAAARVAGYATGPTDCDRGAAEAVGLSSMDGHVTSVSVYFDDEADARAAADAFTARGVVGHHVAQVQTFCLD